VSAGEASRQQMGRVRRYKKFKAADPFSKRTKVVTDTVHDEPPESFNKRQCNEADI
jgi:hypothetical protein